MQTCQQVQKDKGMTPDYMLGKKFEIPQLDIVNL